MTRIFNIYKIDDIPGYRFEIAWTDSGGEEWNEEVKDLDAVIERLRQVFANE